MQGFVYLFELFTILIGLSIAVMLKGFADILRLRFRRQAGVDKNASEIKIGWLLPLLGMFTLFNLASLWLTLQPLRETLPFNFASIMGIIVLMGCYYILASLVFPSEPERWLKLDDYYWQSKRFILLNSLILIIITNVILSILGFNEEIPNEYYVKYPLLRWAILLVLLSIPFMLWAALSKSRMVNYLFLIFYNIMNINYLIVTAITPPYTKGMAL